MSRLRTLKVLTVDRDTYHLRDVEFEQYQNVRHLGGMNFAFDTINSELWARSERPLKEGEVVRGTFDFDPKESMRRGSLPTLQIAK